MAQEILPQLVALKLKDKPKGFMLVDIRPADERKLTHIPGDVHIPAEKFSVDAAKYKDNDVVLYCHHGVRSAVLADALGVRGIKVKSMAGGIDAWSDNVDAQVKKYGHEHN